MKIRRNVKQAMEMIGSSATCGGPLSFTFGP